MPVPAMVEPDVDHQRRFQAAVDVIHNLPKNGCYRPSYEVMLRFYSLYKQAVCGPCTSSRPGFWDPVGRYKWDAWSRLGDMSTESAMAAYVDEMKKVAQEVIDTMPMDEKTASLLHHFEPLYLVIDDMPRPPEALLSLRDGLKGVDDPVGTPDLQEEEESSPPEGPPGPSSPAEDQMSQSEEGHVSENPLPNDSGVSEGLLLTSDSENEIFCDSVDSVEQLGHIKAPVLKSNGVQNGHVTLIQSHGRQVGAGQGGEGAEDGKGPTRRSRDGGREMSHGWRERGVPQGSPRQGGGPGGGGAGRGGGGAGPEGGAERVQDAQLQQQIILALQRLREDMRSVMERLEAVERLAAAHGSEWRTCVQCSASHEQEVKWWPLDVSTPTVLLFLLWPFVAQGLLYLLRKGQRRRRGDISS
ncbi:acyl-CoA-binding domain-containing protein 4 isoform X2 [Sphaeramia orbicularis]|uniref:ACB domain-containing protein n=1 Tax=Sphaeramia orbicularis TaxID=375764 RepID=A0A673AGZ9_9TELE|nr:acyl-CoA-binding domain-containing protein 4 isoform X2 [Sphaeramia orbicularis]